MQKRRRFKHEKTFEERLAEEAQRLSEAARELPPGTARELLLRRAQQAERAAHINKWLTSPGLQPPKELEDLAGCQKK
nr:hypothetical protein [Bradyrhizobium sp. LMTR 3]